MYAFLMVVGIVAANTAFVPYRPHPRGLCGHMGFNPVDCTQFVPSWLTGSTVRSVARSCPIGQFLGADAITCRPYILAEYATDPCRHAPNGFTYGMADNGCRFYWRCLDGVSVGSCCPAGRAYFEGIGCLVDPTCHDICPPRERDSVTRTLLY